MGIGGIGPRRTLGDVWASQTGGRSWLCTYSEAPFGARCDAGLVTVPNHPMRIVLCGGLDANGGFCNPDAWVGSEAGALWERIEVPWPSRTLPPLAVTGDGRLLVLGGQVGNNHRDGFRTSTDCWELCCLALRQPGDPDAGVDDAEIHDLGDLSFAPKAVVRIGGPQGELVALDDLGGLWVVPLAAAAPEVLAADWGWQCFSRVAPHVAGYPTRALCAGRCLSVVALCRRSSSSPRPAWRGPPPRSCGGSALG